MMPEVGHRRVLILDDDPVVRALVAAVLGERGFRAREAADGAEALGLLAREPPFDLIVLDLRMPVIDGETFYRSLRLAGDETPVLILSAYADRSRTAELHAEATLAKPFDIEELASVAAGLAMTRSAWPGADAAEAVDA
jgi:two-component system response regulator MprA